VEWKSSARREDGGHYKGDNTLRSFLFTPRNPGGLPLRKFAIPQSVVARDRAFGNLCIFGSDNSNASTDSYTYDFGRTHDSASGEWEEDFLTGAEDFIVKEIEVFEIADSKAFPANRENGSLLQEVARNRGERIVEAVTSRGIRLGGSRETGTEISVQAAQREEHRRLAEVKGGVLELRRPVWKDREEDEEAQQECR
jgi:hypothetical protein